LKQACNFEQSISLEQQLVTEATSSLPEIADAIISKGDMTALEYINNTDR